MPRIAAPITDETPVVDQKINDVWSVCQRKAGLEDEMRIGRRQRSIICWIIRLTICPLEMAFGCTLNKSCTKENQEKKMTRPAEKLLGIQKQMS
jgi:hypothetical protein